MEQREQPDVFFSYNNADEALVLEIYRRVTARGLTVWLDKPNMAAGFPWIQKTEEAIKSAASAAILIGAAGIGPTQQLEVNKFVEEHTKRQIPIIPVLLPGAPPPKDLPYFLSSFHAITMPAGITDEGIERLVRGVSGIQATEVNRALLVIRAKEQQPQARLNQFVDAMGIASIKSRLHALSEIVAQAAVQSAAYAADTFREDILSVILPVAVEMRWRRGYAAAIERMLRIPEGQKRLSDFICEEVASGCAVIEGVLSARAEADGRVTVLLNEQPVLRVGGFRDEDRGSIVESVEMHGRLGVPSRGGLSISERIGEVPVRVGDAITDNLAAILFQNREVLAPILARLPIPEMDWLLAEDENYGSTVRQERTEEDEIPVSSLPHVRVGAEEIFDARTAVDPSRPWERINDAWERLTRSAGFGGSK